MRELLPPTVAVWQDWLAALCLWREARGLPFLTRSDSFRAIFHVMLNRLADHRWPNTLQEVILQPFQFSSFNAKDSNVVKFPPVGSPIFRECITIVLAPGNDPTGGATHYETNPNEATDPIWAKGQPCYTVGPFEFYKL